MIGLSTAGLIAVVRALDWSLIAQWVVGIGWIPFCGFMAYKVNKKLGQVAIEPKGVAHEPVHRKVDAGPATIPGSQRGHQTVTPPDMPSPAVPAPPLCE